MLRISQLGITFAVGDEALGLLASFAGAGFVGVIVKIVMAGMKPSSA